MSMLHSRTILTLGIIAYSVSLGAGIAHAQVVPPSNVSPGAVLQETQKNSGIQPSGQKQSKKPAKIEGAEEEKPATIQDTRRVMIKTIQVDGVTLVDQKKVQEIVSGYENKESSFSDLQELAQKLTTLYRDKGYVTSRVYLPPQKIENGQLTLQASEGHVGEVNVEGNRFFRARVIENTVSLEKGEAFNVKPLQRSLRLLNDNPDQHVSAVLKAGKDPGETDVDLKVTDHFPIHLTPTFDNLGRRLIGTKRLGFTLSDNNVTGLGDRDQAGLNWTRRSFGVVNHYEVPVLNHGTKLNFDYAYSKLHLGEEFKLLKVQGSAVIFSPSISQQIFSNDRFRISADVAFDFKNLKTDILDLKFSRDRLRVLRPGLNFEEYDTHGQTFMRHEFGLGLDLLGGTQGDDPLASREGAGTKFFRYTGSVTRVQKLPWSTYAVLRGITQLTPDRLVSAEQLQMGGAYTVRGYKEGRIIGDSGLILSGEWRIPFFLFPKSWKIPKTQYGLRDNIQMVTFTDFGFTSTNDPAVGVKKHEYVMGVGAGIRARLTKFIVGRVDIGIPLIRQAPDTQVPRLHFALQSELF